MEPSDDFAQGLILAHIALFTARYRRDLAAGRITPADLRADVAEALSLLDLAFDRGEQLPAPAARWARAIAERFTTDFLRPRTVG